MNAVIRQGAAFAPLLIIVAIEVAGHASATDVAKLPPRLSDTGLYEPDRPGVVASRNRPFAPQYPLWSDGAVKRRWVHLPEGATIDARDADDWQFPAGTKFWKEFSFNGRKVETRVLWKASAGRWLAGSYAWNEAGTDAVLVEDGVPAVVEVAPGRWHAIPSRADCATCHGTPHRPLGFNRLQLSTDRDPNAIHGEPLTAGMLTLRELVGDRLLSPSDEGLLSRPPRIAARDPRTRTLLGYLSANCGSCHNSGSAITARVPSLGHADVIRDGEAVARHLVGQRTNWQAPGRAEGSTVLIDPASPETSAILLRMASRRPSSQMPPLGTVLRDQVAVDAVLEWAKEVAPAMSRQSVSQAGGQDEQGYGGPP